MTVLVDEERKTKNEKRRTIDERSQQPLARRSQINTKGHK